MGFCLPVLVSPLCADQPHKTHKAAKPSPAQQPPPAPAPEVPLTLQQMPATPPDVSYANGQLTIVAQNSTLGDVLRAVRDRTGANLEVPGNATERVVSHIGPGSPKDVLAQLLDGSHFNYVILGSPTDSAKLERVILSPKPAPTGDAGGQQNNATPQPQPAQDDSSLNDATATDDDDNTEPQQDQPNQPPGQAPVRTPEQLLQELQRQQQQQQGQQPQPGQQPAPNAPHQQN